MTKDITKVHICIWQTVADKDPSFGGSKLLLESPPHDLEDWIRVCSEIRRVNKNPVCAFRAAKQAGLAFVHVGLTINGCEHGLTCETPDPIDRAVYPEEKNRPVAGTNEIIRHSIIR